MKTRNLLGLLALAVAAASLASATTINCAGVPDVVGMTTAGNNCNVTGAPSIIFSAFSVSFTGGASGPVGISSNPSLTNVTGNDINIGFQFPSPTNGAGDILIFYTVTGGIDGIDLVLQAAPTTNGGSVTVVETACAVAFVGGTCGSVLGTINTSTVGTTVDSQSVSFATTQTVYIKKDIGFNGAGLSEFQNSQLTPLPEPMTLSMLGAGLLGLGLFGRKLRK